MSLFQKRYKIDKAKHCATFFQIHIPERIP